MVWSTDETPESTYYSPDSLHKKMSQLLGFASYLDFDIATCDAGIIHHDIEDFAQHYLVE